jgi:ATPase subunit of ABC transporter with duplicated ATPase domains
MSKRVSLRSSLSLSSKLTSVLLRATDLRLHYAEKPILDGVNLLLAAGDKIALTGRNGSGKTTLLYILTGQTKFESGSLEIFGRIGWLRQERDFAKQTVREVMQQALAHLAHLEQHLRDLETQNQIGQAWAETLETFERLGGYAAPAKAASTLEALGLGGLLEREASTLSGGEQTRLALAAVLLENPEVLLLDEPTNHLDIAMREWLEKRLQEFSGALLIVSHDRRLLDAVCSETLHLEKAALTRFVGGYSRARAARLEQRRIQLKAARLGGFELRRLQNAAKTLNTWGANNDKLARRAKAIATRAERVVQTEAPAKERILRLKLESGSSAAKLVLRATGIAKHFGERPILHKADLRLRFGDRVALLAPNGAGKTTLLRILLGDLAPDVPNPLEPPEVRYADGVTVAYFDQTWHGLDAKKSVLEQLSAKVGERSAKALLGRYGFPPEAQTRAPSTLSGGERARAGLALIAATRADVLFLDEPTNHLDVETLEALEEAILGYPGSVLFVTHDRQFAKAVATRVLTIEQGNLLEFLHGFAGYERFRRGERQLLDPARLLEGELAPPVVQRVYTFDQQLQLLEERLMVLEDYFLHRGMTEREWQRYRAEARAIVLRLSELHNERFALPLEFDFSMRVRMLEVRAIGDNGAWQFWAKNSSGCPFLVGNFENAVLVLMWQGEVGAALPWFRRAVLLGALGIAFEQMGVATVRLPEAVAPFGLVVGSLEYARALGLARKPKKRRRRQKKRLAHGS